MNLKKSNRFKNCCFIALLISLNIGFGQQSTNTDSLLFQAQKHYKEQAYPAALKKVDQGLLLAPDYHDIRELRVRIAQALTQMDLANKDLMYLLKRKKDTLVFNLALRQMNHLQDTKAIGQLAAAMALTPFDNAGRRLATAQAYWRAGNKADAKRMLKSVKKKNLTAKENYLWLQLSKKLRRTTLAVYHEVISFMADFPVRKSWNTTQVVVGHTTKKFSILGKISESKRFTDAAFLFESTAYATLSEKLYTRINFGVSSKNNFYQNFGVDASGYLTLFKSMELEVGGKYLKFNDNAFYSGIIGSTFYTGNYYINLRTFIGPKINQALVQSYQATVRYYFKNGTDYIFTRVGTGISQDESLQFTQIVDNPDLNSYFGSLGASKGWGNYTISAQIGYQKQELSSDRMGNQLLTSIGLKYRL